MKHGLNTDKNIRRFYGFTQMNFLFKSFLENPCNLRTNF